MESYGNLARIYDGEYGGLSADLDLYLSTLAAERVAGPVVELGCGTGRVAIPLAVAGHRVTGLDVSAAMLRRARRRRRSLPAEASIRLRFSHQDMTDFVFPRRFSAGIVAFSTFNLLATAEDRGRCLDRLGACLEPGGLLILDLVAPMGQEAGVVRHTHRTSFRLAPWGHVVEKVAEECEAPGTGVVRVTYRYAVRRSVDDRVVDRLEVGFDLARVSRREVEAGLYARGFDVEAVAGDYRWTPFREGHPRLLVKARRLR